MFLQFALLGVYAAELSLLPLPYGMTKVSGHQVFRLFNRLLSTQLAVRQEGGYPKTLQLQWIHLILDVLLPGACIRIHEHC